MRGIGIALDENFDVKINPVRDSSGKIIRGVVLEKTLPQNQAVILKMQPGELKRVPYLGCGIDDIVNDNDLLAWKRKIRMQMEQDMQVVNDVKFTSNNKLQIDARYNS